MPIYKKFGLIKIDDARIDETCSAYFKWKDLNTYIKSNSNRGINMPDAISEPMGCYCLDLVWNRGKKVGDATNPRTNEKVEMKATSRFEGDLSSFGPDCSFDDRAKDDSFLTKLGVLILFLCYVAGSIICSYNLKELW